MPTARSRPPAACWPRTADGEGVVVVAGRPSYAESGEVAAEAAARPGRALPEATFLPALRRGNVLRRPRHGPGPGPAARPGRPRGGRAVVHGRLGLGARPARARHGRHPRLHGRRAGRTGDRGARPGAARRRPARATSPTAPWPSGRSAAGHFVVAVDGHPSRVGRRHADVVLPVRDGARAAGHDDQHRGPGQPARPEAGARPGFAWPDWMIAAELAAALGADLGLASVNDLWDEIERRRAGLRRASPSEVLDSDAAHDGILVPLAAAPVRPPRRRRARSTRCRCPASSRSSARARRRRPASPSRRRASTAPRRRHRAERRAARRPCCSGPGTGGDRAATAPQGRQLLAAPGRRAAASTTPAAR